MGIYDREYIRRDAPGFFGSFTTGRGQVCKWLILINALVFVAQLITSERQNAGPVTDGLMLDANAVVHGQVWRLLTYAFLHDPRTWMHIVFNMLFLWWFGPDLEDMYGPREFLAFYLLSALVGGAAFVLAYQANLPGRYCLGASGAVMAVLVLCACHYPHRTILLFFILPIPIWFFILFLLVPDAYHFLSSLPHRHDPNFDEGTRTAVTVHLAGAAFAFAYYKRRWRLMDLWTDVKSWQKQLSRPRLKVYREEHVPSPLPYHGPSRSAADQEMDAQLDAVLEKVARTGRDSLTQDELQVLLRASEIYRRRRT